MSLLAALIQHFVQNPCRVFIVLHFYEAIIISPADTLIADRFFILTLSIWRPRQISLPLKWMSIMTGSQLIGVLTFIFVSASPDNSFVEGHPVPLYKLRLGINRQSGGIYCAESCGLPPSIITRAQEISQTLSRRSVIEPLKQYNTLQMDRILEKLELLDLFLSVQNWKESSEEEIQKIRTLLHIGDKR